MTTTSEQQQSSISGEDENGGNRLVHRTSFADTTSTLTVHLEGEVDLESTPLIGRYLQEAHQEAQLRGAKEVALDLTQLQFVNSSGIKHFVNWLRDASRLAPEIAYNIRIISSPLIPWQRRSLGALRCFAPNILTIETVQS
jgi:anti-anti-sigma factor